MRIRTHHPVVLALACVATHAALAGPSLNVNGQTRPNRSPAQVPVNPNTRAAQPRPQVPPPDQPPTAPPPPQQGTPAQPGGFWHLTSNPRIVSTGNPVKFELQPTGRAAALPNLIIDFDDDASEPYHPGIEHTYTTTGAKHVRILAPVAGATMMAQTRAPIASVDVEVNAPPPTPVASPTPSPTATPSPTPSPTPTPTPSPTPSPTATPDDPVFGGQASPSPSAFPSVTPLELTSGTARRLIDWVKDPRHWWVFLAVVVGTFVGNKLLRTGFAPSPSPTFHCAPDIGAGDVNDGMRGLAIATQIVLTPNIRDGDYQITTGEAGLIKEIRRHNA
ncbi:MAG: hypothetical protein QOD75_1979 [Blastocatellia bacterium]|jgi:hypothetical protein|nr:hypothetical protein [Blastocatellia bacterium]